MATFKNIIFAANSTDTSSMEAFNIILDELNYQDLHIGFYDFKLDGDSLSTAISNKVQQIKKEDLPDNDLIISIGGDGTMLKSAKLAHQFNTPITGINRGRLGFLTDINPDQAAETLSKIINGLYKEEKRLLIEATINGKDQDGLSGYALNDIAIKRIETGRMIRIKTSIDNNYINTHEGDGFVVATPTGSTAYALSCGGPILKPDIEAFVLVPICPHSLNDRPLVIPSHSEISVSVDLSDGEMAAIDLDGDDFVELSSEDILLIRASSTFIKLIHPENYDYFDVLRTKLYWGQNKRTSSDQP